MTTPTEWLLIEQLPMPSLELNQMCELLETGGIRGFRRIPGVGEANSWRSSRAGAHWTVDISGTLARFG
jgi:hypothetical protein